MLRLTPPKHVTFFISIAVAIIAVIIHYAHIDIPYVQSGFVILGVGAAARRAGVKCSPHVLRHTAAVWMAEDGVPMEQVAQYLGHNDSRTTERVYARFSPDFLRADARSLDL